MALTDQGQRAFSVLAGLRALVGLAADNFLAERARWLLWTPVLLGIGIGCYFVLRNEPPAWSGAVASASLLPIYYFSRRFAALQLAVLALLIATVGFAAAQFRVLSRDAPMISKEIGPVAIEGRLLALERFNDGTRLLIAPGSIGRFTPLPLPTRIRIKLAGKQAAADLRPGDQIRLRAKLMPPPGPVTPGGFDYGRMLWFERVGAVGFSIGAPQRLEPVAQADFLMRAEIWLAALRDRLTRRIIAAIPGDAGPVSAALMTGERGAISDPVNLAMRDSGLVHLLSISGLHMGFLAGIVFFGVRGALALIEPVALRYPIKKWAAALALLGIFLYLLISGASIPTQRSFIMTGVVLLAVMLDRLGISMRLVCIAGALILLMTPESLHLASFQLSFAAVVALVAWYEWTSWRRAQQSQDSGWLARAASYVLGMALTSLIAGLATAPLIAFHFNRFALFSLLANMLAVPLTGIWIMPCAVAAFALMPFGLERWALAPMGIGVEWVIVIAEWVAALPGAVGMVAQPPVLALLLVVAGGLWICLWTRPWRWAGAGALALGLAVAPFGNPPDILVESDGKLIAVRGEDGQMLLSSSRGAAHSRSEWAKSEGSALPLSVAGKTQSAQSAQCDLIGCRFTARGGHVVAYVRDGMALAEDCRSAEVVIASVVVRACPSAKIVIDKFDLRRGGGHALWFEKSGGIRVESVAQLRGNRPWAPLVR